MFRPTWVDLGMLLGSFGLFFTLFLLFCRFLPMVAMAEVKTVMPQAHGDCQAPAIRLSTRSGHAQGTQTGPLVDVVIFATENN